MTAAFDDVARAEMLLRIRRARADATSAEVPRHYRGVGHAVVDGSLLDLLEDRLLDYQAGVRRCLDAELADTILDLVGEDTVVVPPGLPASWYAGLRQVTVDDGLLSADELDRIRTTLTASASAAAVTGTIVLDGSPDQGRRVISLVPDHHVCVVRASQVVAGIPDLVAAVDPTRPLTFISGPSATSDIELERVEGVHGPRRLDVVLVTDLEAVLPG